MFPIRACRDRCPHRPALPVYTAPLVGADGSVRPICAPILFFLFRRKKRTAAASEEASSIPFPPERRKLHIRWLLLPFRKPTAALGRLSVNIRKERELPKPGAQTVPPSCDNSFAQSYLPAPGHISAGNYAPHAILMMAGRQHFADTFCRGGRLCPPKSLPPRGRHFPLRRGGANAGIDLTPYCRKRSAVTACF